MGPLTTIFVALTFLLAAIQGHLDEFIGTLVLTAIVYWGTRFAMNSATKKSDAYQQRIRYGGEPFPAINKILPLVAALFMLNGNILVGILVGIGSYYMAKMD